MFFPHQAHASGFGLSPQITNWDELRASLPLSFQRKLNFKQKLASDHEPSVKVSPFDSFVLDDLHVSESFLNPREVNNRESDEFEEWFDLANKFGIADDYEWHFQEYLVLSQGEWVPYCELSAMFTVSKLRKFLGLDPG